MSVLPERWRAWAALALLTVGGLLFASPAAALVRRLPTCPDGGTVRAEALQVTGISESDWARLRDGKIAREGEVWPAPDVLVTAQGLIDIRLPRGRLGALRLQVDADQSFVVEVSSTGYDWRQWTVEGDLRATGMLLRTIRLGNEVIQEIRIRPRNATDRFALTELDVLCQNWRERGLQIARDAERPEPRAGVDPRAVDLVKLALVAGALSTLLLHRRLTSAPRVEIVTKSVLALLAVAAYTNFGALRGGRFLHMHDAFHYVIGARYFPELGYDAIYDCAAKVEADAGFTERVRLRTQRDLRTGKYQTGDEALAGGADCRERFTGDRFQQFTADVRAFANRMSVPEWHVVLRDHGFNASPAWIGLGRSLLGPLPYVFFDVVLLAAVAAGIAACVGFRAAFLAIVVFTCNPLADFSWTGGAFLRQAWFAALILGLCALARRRFGTGGVLLGVSSILQLFPLAALGAVALGGAAEWVRTRRVSSEARRILIVGAATIALAVPLSVWTSGRGDAWSAFAWNTARHAATPAVNLVGLPSALSFRPSTRAAVLFDADAVDPFARIRAARLENGRALRPVHWLCVATMVVALIRVATRSRAPFLDPALGLLLVPIALETSCYYTSWLVALVVTRTSPSRSVAVLGTLALELVCAVAISDDDTRYALSSVVLVLGACAVLALELRGDREREAPT